MIINRQNTRNTLLWAAIITSSQYAFSFENTKTLPKGIRNLSVRYVSTDIYTKTSDSSSVEPLAKPLMKDLKFKDMLRGEDDALKKIQLAAFLQKESGLFNLNDSVGTFDADLKAGVRVIAPIFGYGITDKLTLAIAVPYYQAATDVSVGFHPNATGQRFLDAFHAERNAATFAAREAGRKLNDAVGELNTKLVENGYQALGSWSGQGLGDMTVAAKWRGFQNSSYAIAVTGGAVLPTGKVDDPDVLTDLPFGDGQPDIFSQLSADTFITPNFTLNTSAKYTYQIAGEKPLRWKTEEEAIEVDTRDTKFKLGDKFEGSASLQAEDSSGVQGGVGYLYTTKEKDRYKISAQDVKSEIEKDTSVNSHFLEMKLGYSTLPAFKRKQAAVPMSVSLEYRRHLRSRNSPTNDLTQMDISLFF